MIATNQEDALRQTGTCVYSEKERKGVRVLHRLQEIAEPPQRAGKEVFFPHESSPLQTAPALQVVMVMIVFVCGPTQPHPQLEDRFQFRQTTEQALKNVEHKSKFRKNRREMADPPQRSDPKVRNVQGMFFCGKRAHDCSLFTLFLTHAHRTKRDSSV